MICTERGIAFIQGWESLKLEAYLDTGGVWTIGWGTTRYPNGKRVRAGDTCTLEQADQWFRYDLTRFEIGADDLTTDHIDRHQFDALVSFVYNVGEGAYRGSTLRRKLNLRPTDPSIRWEFMKWHYDDGKPIRGLWRRRHAEADLYEDVSTTCPTFPHGT